jgi:hypothetical protein|nr:MAG TPA: hypothetical protein [Bacteriophage sp.]
MLNNNLFNAEQLALIADIMQVANYVENLQQTSNDRILQELERQNKVYLEEILKRLERLENAQVNKQI